MSKTYRIAAFSLAAVLMASAAAFAADAKAESKAENKVLATIGAEKITQADVDRLLNSLDPRQRAQFSTPENQHKLVEDLVDTKVFSRSAREQKLQDTPEFKAVMARIEEQMLIRVLTEKVAAEASKKPVSDADVQKFYDEHKEVFQVPAAVRASHILIRSDKNMPKKDQEAAQKKAAELLHEIELGKVTFEDAAKNNSADGTRSRGGDLGFFVKGQMVPPFEKAAFSLKKGQMTSKPVKTEFGWHIIKVTDTRDASFRPLAEVKEDIKTQLMQERMRNALIKERDALRAKYGVKFMTPPEAKSADTAPAPAAPAAPAK